METAVVLTRLVQYVAVAAAGGGALFFVYGPRPATVWPARLVGGAALAGALAAGAWLMIQTAQIGERPSDAFSLPQVWQVASGTSFGRAGLLRLLLLLLAAAVSMPRRPPFRLLAGLGAAAAASFAWTGHGAAQEGLAGAIHLGADVLHLLAASAWIGALFALAALLFIARRSAARSDAEDAAAGLAAFSRIGAAVVAAVVLSGLVNSWFLVGPAAALRLTESLYGRLLLAKLAAFAAMLGLAAANRYMLTAALERALQARSGRTPSAALVASVAVEALLALGVIALVSWMGTIPPASEG